MRGPPALGPPALGSPALPSARVPAEARYVAIITDGNGRWARARGLHVNEGHSAAAAIGRA
jgi:undecaprenyl diphosphate synthase